jgi:prolyl oligopeptidase
VLPSGTSLTSFAVGPTRIAVAVAGPRGDTVYTVSANAVDEPSAVSSGIGRIDALTADPACDRFWWNFLSHTRPRSVHSIDLSAGPATTMVWYAPPTAALAPRTTCSLASYLSPDGTEVDLTVFGRDDLTGPAPMLLTAYGGFGLTLTPAFRADLIVWLAAGGRYAVAHIRGGRDKGRSWHEAARGRTKVRAVEDFEAAAEYAVADGLADPGTVVALGGSNGGLIVTSACVRRPDLFAGAVAVAPVTDLVRFPDMGGDGRTWISEYGDPRDPDDLAALLTYSPLHNVRDGVKYPPMLISVGSGDQRVHVSHGRKLCAALQAVSSVDSSALYRDQRNAGHGIQSQQSSLAALVDHAVFLAAAAGLDLCQAGPAPSPVRV